MKVIADAAAVAPATVHAAFATPQAVLSVLIDEALASALPDPEHPDAWPDIVAHPDQRERARRLVILMSVSRLRVGPCSGWYGIGARAAWIVDVLAGLDGLPTSFSPWAAPRCTTFSSTSGAGHQNSSAPSLPTCWAGSFQNLLA